MEKELLFPQGLTQNGNHCAHKSPYENKYPPMDFRVSYYIANCANAYANDHNAGADSVDQFFTHF